MVRTRAKKEVLEKVPDWRGFLDMLCEPPPAGDDEHDDDDEEEEEEAPTTVTTETASRSSSAAPLGKAVRTKLQAKLDAAADSPAAAPPSSGARRVALWCHEHAFLSLPAVLLLNTAASYANAGIAGYVASNAAVALLALADALVV
jgi:hypothetical protein